MQRVHCARRIGRRGGGLAKAYRDGGTGAAAITRVSLRGCRRTGRRRCRTWAHIRGDARRCALARPAARPSCAAPARLQLVARRWRTPTSGHAPRHGVWKSAAAWRRALASSRSTSALMYHSLLNASTRCTGGRRPCLCAYTIVHFCKATELRWCQGCTETHHASSDEVAFLLAVHRHRQRLITGARPLRRLQVRSSVGGAAALRTTNEYVHECR